MDYSLRVNDKRIGSGSKHPPSRQQRNRQFQHIAHLQQSFAEAGQPVISMSTSPPAR